ncbi:unnamed protein product [Dicrocoelium dendriticum]|nr:unnamed protein product [Dicrocoelium dendriticum]
MFFVSSSLLISVPTVFDTLLPYFYFLATEPSGTLGHIPPSTLATPLSTSSIGPSRECTLARNRSLRSTEERNRSHVHFSPLLINSPDVLHGNSFVSSKSEMQLTHPVATHKRSHVEDLRTSSPSYLRVAVAAFGYPTYAGDSSPFTRSIPAQRLRPMQLSLSSHQTNTVAFSSPDSPLHAAANLMSRSTAPSAHFQDPSLSAQSAHNSGATNFTFNLRHPSVPKDAVSNSTGQPARESSASQHHKCSSVSPCPSPNVNVQPTPNGPTLRGPRVRSQAGTPDDHEHWQRSSLIMLAVTHASPRGRTSGVHESQQHSHIFDGIGDLSHFNDYSSPSGISAR